MTSFDFLKGLQTGTAISTLVLLMILGATLVRDFRRPFPQPGYVMALAVWNMCFACFVLYGWQVGQYWFYGVDEPILLPIELRIFVQFFFLIGASLFISLTQQANMGFGPTLALWSTLLSAFVVMITFIG